MLTVGGLLLGAVLSAPPTAGGATPADPFGPTTARATSAQGDAALGLRDPFAPEARLHAAHRRPPRPSEVDVDLRDPFAANDKMMRRQAAAAASTHASADLRAPFEHARRATGPAVPPTPAAAPAQHPELRDPFAR